MRHGRRWSSSGRSNRLSNPPSEGRGSVADGGGFPQAISLAANPLHRFAVPLPPGKALVDWRRLCRLSISTSMTKYLHTMIRVTDPAATVRFFELLGLHELRRIDSEKGRFTLIFLAAPGDEEAQVELTHNWDPDPEPYSGGRNFGHLAYAVDDVYATCQRLIDGGVTINRPPREGRMAFVRTPDNISIELLQKGENLPVAEPWASMPNVGEW